MSEPFLAAAPNLAWVWCSYFGQDGRGVTDVMFGDVPASGALPYTIPLKPDQLGDIHNYAMTAPPYGKTYRYLQYRNLTGLYNSSVPATWIYNVSVPAAPLHVKTSSRSFSTPQFKCACLPYLCPCMCQRCVLNINVLNWLQMLTCIHHQRGIPAIRLGLVCRWWKLSTQSLR